jgi:ABC-2 type transport system permease protein
MAGHSYDVLLDGQNIQIGSIDISYPAYLATAFIGINIMNNCILTGAIIWNDKRNGMFQQLLVMPFTRMQYIISNLSVITLMSVASAIIVLAMGLPFLLNEAVITPLGVF